MFFSLKFEDKSSHISEQITFNEFTSLSELGYYVRGDTDNLHIIHLNIRSLRKNFAELIAIVKECTENLDLILLSEINIKENEVYAYAMDGYQMYAYTRKSKKGGGLLLYVKNSICIEVSKIEGHAAEILQAKICYLQKIIHFVGIYRPPNTNKNCFVNELKEILKKIPTNNDIIVTGDMNINLENISCNIVEKYKNTLCSFGLQSFINVCTRDEIVDGRRVTSCIDHLWVRSRAPSEGILLTCKLSDHYLIGARLETGVSVRMINGKQTKVCALSNKLVREKLGNIQWRDFQNIDDPLVLYSELCSLFSAIYDESRIMIKPKNNRDTQPWVTQTLQSRMRRRDDLFRQWKANPKSATLRLIYTRYRNRVNKAIHTARNIYRQNLIKDCDGDCRQLWSIIGDWLGNKKLSVDQVVEKYLGKTDSMQNICTNFAKTFTEEIINIKHNCNHKFLDRSDYVRELDKSFRFQPVNAHVIEKIIDRLSNKKSPGVDCLRIQDIKYVKKEISPILAKFVNKCAQGYAYPDILKKSIIKPIYKNGDHCQYANYRPIAILSVINKIVEKVIVGQLQVFLDRYLVINDAQHGFRRQRSCSTALTKFVDEINMNLDQRMYVVALFLDYKKAFDTLDHPILLKAMEECGVRGPLNAWFQNYLSNRTLRTNLCGTTGEEAAVVHGVPTGSVYGPVGYTMHVNSLTNVVKHCSCYMYADDTCLMYADRDLRVIESMLQADLDQIMKWSHDNGLIINLDKTKGMLIQSPYIKKADYQIKIVGHAYTCLHNGPNQGRQCTCVSLEFVSSYRYLGLILDDKMSWNTHVNHVCDKLRVLLVKFYKLKNLVSRKILFMLYHSLVDAVVSYGITAYGRTFKTNLDKIKQIQTRFLKLIVNKKVKISCKGNYGKLYKICNVLPVHEKVFFMLLVDEFNICEFKGKSKVSMYNTRSCNNVRYDVAKTKNYFGERTRGYLIPYLYNKLQIDDDNYKSKNVFKKCIKKLLLDGCEGAERGGQSPRATASYTEPPPILSSTQHK